LSARARWNSANCTISAKKLAKYDKHSGVPIPIVAGMTTGNQASVSGIQIDLPWPFCRALVANPLL